VNVGEAGSALVASIGAVPAAEWVAVVLAFAYLVLAVRQNPWCWACAIASAAIYLVLFAHGELVMQARALGLDLNRHGLRRQLEGMLTTDLSCLAVSPDDATCLTRAEQLMDLGQALSLELDLWAPQNHFYRLLQDFSGRTLPEGVRALGRRLHFVID